MCKCRSEDVTHQIYKVNKSGNVTYNIRIGNKDVLYMEFLLNMSGIIQY